jgi:gamma-glutamyltranspeptidase / glutathione hydrolase
VDDGLLSARFSGIVYAWFLLLDRWGTMSFAQVHQPAVELAKNRFPIPVSLVKRLADGKNLRKYPTSRKLFHLDGPELNAGDIL